MKLSDDTVAVLKNFGSIYEGISFKRGKILKTISRTKDILAECEVGEEIPKDFCLFDLNNFLSVLSLYKDNPDLSFSDAEKCVILSGLNGRSKMLYRFCDESLICVPPEKAVSMPQAEVSFDLSKDDFDWIRNVNNIIGAPNISIRSDGKKIKIVSFDAKNDSSAINELEIGDGNGDSYEFIFKTESVAKLMNMSYNVNISSKGVANFKCKEKNLQYWITTQPGSTFKPA